MLCLLRYNFDVRKGPVKIEWFVGAETNLTYNALDRHVEAGHGDRVAFYWEGNDLNEQSVTKYKQLLDQASTASMHMLNACQWYANYERQEHLCSSRWLVQVCQLANYLKSIGVKKGSDVTIYMPMIPELPAAMVCSLTHHLIL